MSVVKLSWRGARTRKDRGSGAVFEPAQYRGSNAPPRFLTRPLFSNYLRALERVCNGRAS